MLTVYKYRLPWADWPVVEMKRGAKILHVGQQGGAAYVWSLVDDREDLERREFCLSGTGHPLPDDIDGPDYSFIGTFLINGGELVFHLFERNL